MNKNKTPFPKNDPFWDDQNIDLYLSAPLETPSKRFMQKQEELLELLAIDPQRAIPVEATSPPVRNRFSIHHFGSIAATLILFVGSLIFFTREAPPPTEQFSEEDFWALVFADLSDDEMEFFLLTEVAWY